MRRLSRVRAAGFTVVELMVTLAVVAILAAIAVPTMRDAIQNSHIKATAQSLQNGMAMARAEAVRLNTQIQFALTADGWDITRIDNAELLQQASGKEKASDLTITPDSADAIVYDAFGRKTAGPTQIDIDATHPTSHHKPLTIEIAAGGAARLCDETAASTEPKACIYH